MSIKALQLTWHSASNRCLVAFWHQPWMPQRPSAACATRLSAQSVGPMKDERVNKFDKVVWRINGVLILCVGVVAGFVLLFAS